MPEATRRHRSQHARLALGQCQIRVAGLQETMHKKGVFKADGLWVVSTGAKGKKCRVNLAVNLMDPYAATARSELRLLPRHVKVLRMARRILVARIAAPLLDDFVCALHAPHAGADGAAEKAPDMW